MVVKSLNLPKISNRLLDTHICDKKFSKFHFEGKVFSSISVGQCSIMYTYFYVPAFLESFSKILDKRPSSAPDFIRNRLISSRNLV